MYNYTFNVNRTNFTPQGFIATYAVSTILKDFDMFATYFALKHLHITCVILSISFFVLRFYWRMRQPLYLKKKWVRIAPHCIDTVLLASAIGLAWMSAQVPFVQAWLGAKIIALFLYIVLGSFALKRAKTRKASWIAFLAALLVFIYIASVALSKQVVPL